MYITVTLGYTICHFIITIFDSVEKMETIARILTWISPAVNLKEPISIFRAAGCLLGTEGLVSHGSTGSRERWTGNTHSVVSSVVGASTNHHREPPTEFLPVLGVGNGGEWANGRE